MQWETYSSNFQKIASTSGYSGEEIQKCLSYAHKLFNHKVPVIFDQRHLSQLVGYQLLYLQRAAFATEHFYRTFTIPKKSDGKRIISEPLPSLKEIQTWILREILETCQVSKYAKAYVRGRSIKENARFHINQKIVLTLDIENFFGSITIGMVFDLFRSLGYSIPVASLLSQLVTLNGVLPQGAPTSPAISNIVMYQVDSRIGAFTKQRGIRYSRYSDDMAFSGDFAPGMIIKFVAVVLTENQLTINSSKTRTRRQHQQQEVTGVVVNDKLSAPRKVRNHVRQAIYYIEKFGLASHLRYTNNNKANYVLHLLGLVNFVLFIDPKDAEFQRYNLILKTYLPSKD